MTDQFTRRAVLRAAAGAGAMVGGILAACTSSPAPPTAPPATPTTAGATASPSPVPTPTPPAPTITATPAPTVRLIVAPTSALVDAPVSVRLSGLAPGQEVTLRAEMLDDSMSRWQSETTFRADAGGGVDVATQRPLSGSYTEADANGPFWSMQPDGGADAPGALLFVKYTNFEIKPALPITFAATVAGQRVATATLDRRFIAPDVTRTVVRERGLYGSLFLPPGGGPFSGVVTFGGSEGGLSEDRAALLASHGFAALALAYFKYPGLPPHPVALPLEYFETAMDWLLTHPGVRKDRLAVTGGSLGGQLVLLLGSLFPRITAVVGYAASGIVGPGAHDPVTQDPPPSWTYRGVPIPFLDFRAAREEIRAIRARETPAGPASSLPYWEAELRDPAAVAQAEIAVERINGPVLLVSGDDDQFMPASMLGERVMARLADTRHSFADRHLRYPDAGHLVGPPYRPTTVRQLGRASVGGTAAGEAAANADSWPKVLTFLDEHLNR